MKVLQRVITSREDALRAIKKIGVEPIMEKKLAEKTRFSVLEIQDVPCPAATIIKQVAISRGSDAVVNKKVIVSGVRESTVLLPGTIRELKLIAEELKKQTFGLPEVGDEILQILEKKDKKKGFAIIGVLNLTPDSFSDGGDYFKEEDAKRRFKEMIKEGADIIDVGAESSRPDSDRVAIKEELRRLEPVFPLFKEGSIPVSIDTYKSEVARRAISKGASIVNDVSALRMDDKMVDVIGDFGMKVILMHMKGTPKTMQKKPFYDDVIKEIMDFFEERIEFCLSHGILEDKIILDPGIGFGKRQIDNLTILARLEEFTNLGFPILIGTSRKSFIGNITGKDPKERIHGSIATVVYSYLKGASIFRVHDVSETKDALSVITCIENPE